MISSNNRMVDDKAFLLGHHSARLKSLYPWFDGQEFASERLAKKVRSLFVKTEVVTKCSSKMI